MPTARSEERSKRGTDFTCKEPEFDASPIRCVQRAATDVSRGSYHPRERETYLQRGEGRDRRTTMMKAVHAAALALVVWYLMTPPIGDNLRPKIGAPLYQWNGRWNYEAYDERTPFLTLAE